MISKYFNKESIKELELTYGEIDVEIDDNFDRVKLYFNKNIDSEKWNEINEKLSEFSSSKGYICLRNDNMMSIDIKPADGYVEILKSFIKPIFKNIKKMIITISASVFILFSLSIFLVHIQTGFSIFSKSYWLEYKIFGLYYIILYIISSCIILFIHSNKYIKTIIKSTIMNSFGFELFAYISIFSVRLLLLKDMPKFYYFYYLLDTVVVSLVVSLFISYVVYQYRRYSLKHRYENELILYNRTKSTINLTHEEIINYSEKNKIKLDEILLPKSGINDLFGILNAKTIEEEQNSIFFPFIMILLSMLLFFVIIEFSFLFGSLKWFEIVILIIIVIGNVIFKTINVLKNDRIRLIYAMFHIEKMKTVEIE